MLIKQLHPHSKKHTGFIFMVFVFLLCQIIPVTSVQAAGIILSDHGDVSVNNDNKCTLREAIESINLGGVGERGCINLSADDFGTDDIILIGSALGTTINLSQGKITIEEDMTIKPAGNSTHVLVQGNDIEKLFFIKNMAQVKIENMSFSGGDDVAGGAFSVSDQSSLNLNRCRVFENTVSRGGGGIYVYTESILTLIDSTVFNNTASVGGAGISAINGNVTLINSTVSGNIVKDGSYGGGIEAFGSNVNLINSTISKNLSTGVNSIGNPGIGGGIYIGPSNGVKSSLNVTNSTISGHVAGGIHAFGTDVTLSNSIVAYSDNRDDCFVNDFLGATLTVSRFNLIEDGSCGTSALNVDPRLGPLADNGGPTATHALLPGSPAVSAGSNAVCAASPINNLDQRGLPRPSLGGTICDIGAYESAEGIADTSFFVIPTQNGKAVIFGL